MPFIETIVRPFVAVPVGPSVRPFPVPSSTADEAEASFGGSGGRTVSWTWDANEKVIPSSEERFNETGRESNKVKVENPDDSEQFVEFCQAKHMTLTRDKGNVPNTPRPRSFGLFADYGTDHDRVAGGYTATREYDFLWKKDNPNTQCKPVKPEKGCR